MIDTSRQGTRVAITEQGIFLLRARRGIMYGAIIHDELDHQHEITATLVRWDDGDLMPMLPAELTIVTP